jgi:NADPH:quinone reductase-like Zn-dependent oxidoreductase
MVQAAASVGAEVVAVVRRPGPVDRLRELGATRVVVAEAEDAAAAAAEAAPAGVDVFVDTTRHVDPAAVPARLNPRGRLLLIAGSGRVELDLWPLYTREIAVLGFVMSAMTVPELRAAADRLAAHPPAVDVGLVLGFPEAARAHELVESGRLPRLPGGTVGRVVLRP